MISQLLVGSLTPRNNMEKISTAVTELEYAGMRFFALHALARAMLSLSKVVFCGGWNMLAPSKCEVPVMVADLLDAGTAKKNKDTMS